MRRSQGTEKKFRSQVWNEMGGGSQFSSSCSETRKGAPKCDCGVEASVVTSWTGVNPGRKVYGCGLFKLHGKRVCRFFTWYYVYHGQVIDERCDDEDASSMKVFGSLLKKIEDMNKKERILEPSLAICCVVIFLIIAYVSK
ncbi:hypothetical protein OROGR_000958 [Orobanche gracilis]